MENIAVLIHRGKGDFKGVGFFTESVEMQAVQRL